MTMIAVPSPLGTLRLRPETDEDQVFRFHLFCESRPPELALLPLDAAARDTLMRLQFQAQTLSYRAQFPDARFDIIELAGERIGRIVVNRPDTMIHIVDHVITPPLRNQGIGNALMQALMAEAGAAQTPVRLKVASSNDPSLRLYRRLGFTPIETVPLYVELEWRAPPGKP